MEFKLFCKHEYKHFNTSGDRMFGDLFLTNKYEFVCKNCGKVIVFWEKDLKEEFEKENSNMKKMNTLKKEYNYEDKELYLSTYGLATVIRYKGKFVDCVLKRYMARGINLLELPYNEHVEDKNEWI